MANTTFLNLTVRSNIAFDGRTKKVDMKNTIDSEDLRLNYEHTLIEEAIRRGKYATEFTCIHEGSFEVNSLYSMIRRHQPDILQIGTVTENGCLKFNLGSRARLADADKLVEILNKVKKPIRLLVLRAYETEDIAKKIVAETSIEGVLCLRYDISNEKCQDFLTAFYELLANGINVSSAFELTRSITPRNSFHLVHKKGILPKSVFPEVVEPAPSVTVFASTPVEIDHAIANLPEEVRLIKEHSGPLNVQECYPTDRRTILMKLAYDRPKIVHFTCHSNPYLVAFYDKDGTLFPLERYWLCKVMKEFKGFVQCVVLNSCENHPIAYALSEHIDYVVGSLDEILQSAGPLFSQYFYDYLTRNFANLPYEDAVLYANSCTSFLFRSQKHCTFFLFKKSDYSMIAERKGREEMQYEKRMLEAKERFLIRYGHLSDKQIERFHRNFDGWFYYFHEDREMQNLVIKFMDNLTYYSEKDVEQGIIALIDTAIEWYQLEEEYTIFTALPSQKRRYNSSFTYLTTARDLFELKKYNVQADIEMKAHEATDQTVPFVPQLAEQFRNVKTFVFIDDMLGSGQTFVDYVMKRESMFNGKHLVYLVIHAMDDGVKYIRKEMKKLGIKVDILACYIAKKAFSLTSKPAASRKKFVAFCKKLGIDPQYILGYGNSEALCLFHNNVPNNTLGIFAKEEIIKDEEGNEKTLFFPLFQRDRAIKTAYLNGVHFKDDIEEAILDYLQRCTDLPDFEALAEYLKITEDYLDNKVNEMLASGKLVYQGYTIRPANRRTLVVLGGSFNPPTAAHQRLLSNAVAELHADYGIFVPSSDAYVTKKMLKQGEYLPPLSEKLRMALLETFTEDHPNLLVSNCELSDDGKGHTYDSMVTLQYENPNATLLFLMGADKLEIFTRWPTCEKFITSFKIAVLAREGQDPMKTIEGNDFLRKYKERFIILQANSDDMEISSSRVRRALLKGEETGEMLSAKVKAMLKANPEAITYFRNDHFFLSNFYPAAITYRGLSYKNAEAAFQAQKCATDAEREQFTDLEPGAAKKLGRTVTLRADWEDVKVSVMQEIVKAKFDQNPELKEMLRKTGDVQLIEGNTWQDTFWGVDLETGKGDNTLGRILMMLRSMYSLGF